MRIESIYWDDANLEHATRHGVSAAEIDQAIIAARRITRNRSGRSASHLLRGTTWGGRSITVALTYDPEARTVRPITAWEGK